MLRKDDFINNDDVTPNWLFIKQSKFKNVENLLKLPIDKFCDKFISCMNSRIVFLY